MQNDFTVVSDGKVESVQVTSHCDRGAMAAGRKRRMPRAGLCAALTPTISGLGGRNARSSYRG